MNTERTAATRLLAPIAVIAIAAIVLFVIATSLGGSEEDSGRRGGGGGGSGSGSGAARKTDEKFYTVEPGDSLSTIADKVGVPVDRLSQLNPELDPQALISGQRVKLR